jgi:hypothetical protein
MPEHDEEQVEQAKSERRKRRFRIRIGWYGLLALVLLGFTVWLLVNMAEESGGALLRVLLGIVIVIAAAALLFKAVDRPTNVD